MTGILLVDKPEGVSSAGVIRALAPRLAATKVGHLGTLDPFASGLLPLCLGEATKIARYLLLERKAYEGTIRLGTATDTLDRTGQVTETAPAPELDAGRLAAAAARFTGPQEQVPPMYSALKRDGVPLYKLARRGIDVAREPRRIEIDRLVLRLRDGERVDFEVDCSKGTYVRVLAADLGRALGTVAHLERLRRTRVGAFRIEEAANLDDLLAGSGGAPLRLVAVRDALGSYAAFPVPAAGLAHLRRGQQAPLAELPPPRRVGETALVVDDGGMVAAVIEARGSLPAWHLVRLLGGSSA